MIGQITERVLSLAERDTAALFERHPDFTIAVNLSAADLHDAASIARVRELAARHRQRKNRFIVEISERGVLQTDLAQQAIGQFREAGVSVAIDDFGTGYSCLSYLASLKLDILKIDKAFVDSLGTQAPTSRVAQYIIAMAQALDLTVIAEGVETLQQFEILRSQRVQLAQGYLFSRPLRMADLLERIGESEARHRRLESSAA